MKEEDLRKQKNQFMSSIMKNPKLAKTFRDAMKAPIGSTKRDQAKSTLSVMKKVSGIRNDGQGGPLQDVGSFISSGWNSLFGNSNPQQSSSTPSPINYNNMLVFPAAPALKTPTQKSIFSSDTSNIQDNALKNTLLPSVNYGSSWGTQSQPATSTKIPEIDYEKERKENPLYPGLKQIFSPSNLEQGSKNIVNSTGGTIGKVLKPVGAVGAATLGAVGTVGLGALSLLESAASSAPKLFTGYNDPSELTSPSETLSWKGADWLATQSPWMKYLSGIDKPATIPPAIPVAPSTTPQIPTLTGTQTTQTSPSIIQPTITPKIEESTGGATRSFNIAADSVSKLLGTTPDTPLTQIPVINLVGAISTNEGYWNGTSKIAVKNNNPGNLKFANQPGATKDSNGFAVFSTADEGAQALINDITAKYNSGKYTTINDLMSVYSPDSDNPASSSYGNTTSSNVSQSLSSGPYSYASDLANANFGGKNLSQVINDNLATYKKALEPLEIQLSNLKAESTNFIPTLTQYLEGQDKNSKAIDAMIKSAKDSLLTTNMADPFTANQYNENLKYLYALKANQNGRYGNYLKSAIADYEADVNKMQTNYDTFKANATDLLNQQNNIDQTTYNDIMTRGAEQWTALDNADTKAYNLGILKQQYYQNGGDTLANGISAIVNTNPKTLADLKQYSEQYLVQGVKDANGKEINSLDLTKVPPEGLIGIYSMINHQGGDQIATTEMLRIGLTNLISNSTDVPKTMSDVKKMLETLRNSGYQESETWANSLENALFSQGGTVSSTLTGFIKTNLPEIKTAIKELVSNSGGFLGIGSRKPGIQDKETWLKNHSKLGVDFLNNLYDTINRNIGEGTAYSKDPMSYVNQLFTGTDDENTKNLAERITISS